MIQDTRLKIKELKTCIMYLASWIILTFFSYAVQSPSLLLFL
jgi:hypothetical protein